MSENVEGGTDRSAGLVQTTSSQRRRPRSPHAHRDFSSTSLEPLPDPHPTSALARVGSTKYCSSILPWRSCGDREPWVGPRHVEKTAHAVGVLLKSLPVKDLVWGGDWNHALEGREYAGSIGGRTLILAAVETLD